MPAIATPPLVASPRLTRPRPMNPEDDGDDAEHDAADTDQQNSAMIATTSDADAQTVLRAPIGWRRIAAGGGCSHAAAADSARLRRVAARVRTVLRGTAAVRSCG